MENTYNYFFSSTPQVLAGIFGLFAVFIIFKINEIKNQINDIKNELLNELNKYHRSFTEVKGDWGSKMRILTEKRDFDNILPELDKIAGFANKNHIGQLEFTTNLFKERYDKATILKKELINKTIRASWITSIAIIYCLIMIIPGSFISHCLFWSIVAFLPAIALSIYIFFNLISIIKYSFKE